MLAEQGSIGPRLRLLGLLGRSVHLAKTPKTRKSDWLVVRSDWMPACRYVAARTVSSSRLRPNENCRSHVRNCGTAPASGNVYTTSLAVRHYSATSRAAFMSSGCVKRRGSVTRWINSANTCGAIAMTSPAESTCASVARASACAASSLTSAATRNPVSRPWMMADRRAFRRAGRRRTSADEVPSPNSRSQCRGRSATASLPSAGRVARWRAPERSLLVPQASARRCQ